jgi:hypothetical protein
MRAQLSLAIGTVIMSAQQAMQVSKRSGATSVVNRIQKIALPNQSAEIFSYGVRSVGLGVAP